MNSTIAPKKTFEQEPPTLQESTARNSRAFGNPTILVATADPEVRTGISKLLESISVNAIWVGSVKDVKSLIGKGDIAACLCGFWLQDGTYREVIRHMRREGIETPAIIVSTPACPQEYGECLAAMNLGALDFLHYPYRQAEFERMLESAIGGSFLGTRFRNAQTGLQLDRRSA